MGLQKISLASVFTVAALVCAAQRADSIPSVKIGKQLWMSKNLDVSTFANGELIMQAKTSSEWKSASDKKMPAWCFYDNDPSNASMHGKLYNWYAAHDPRGLAPRGWHIPSDAEWQALTNFLGEENAGNILKSDRGWNDYNGGPGNGKDSFGFVGLPSGGRGSKGDFGFKGYQGFWWSFVKDGTNDAWYYFLSTDDGKVSRYSSFSKGVGYSVRCIKD
jgi:uncharacterized protein (TIGR02145 family)